MVWYLWQELEQLADNNELAGDPDFLAISHALTRIVARIQLLKDELDNAVKQIDTLNIARKRKKRVKLNSRSATKTVTSINYVWICPVWSWIQLVQHVWCKCKMHIDVRKLIIYLDYYLEISEYKFTVQQ